jgi:hypothetical protein
MKRAVLLLVGLLAACAPNHGAPRDQEPITDTAYLPPPCGDNPVEFGASLHAHPDWREDAVAIIASTVAGRLPGARFQVFTGPVWCESQGKFALGFRKPGKDAFVVLGWFPALITSWQGPPGSFTLPGVEFEVAHLVAGTWDDGSPIAK